MTDDQTGPEEDPPPPPPLAPDLARVSVRPQIAAAWAGIAVSAVLVIGSGGSLLAGTGRVDMAQWLMAAAAIVTLAAAVIAGIFAAGALRLELQREQRRRNADARAQAEMVAGWGTKGVVTLMNVSSLPVYKVRVIVMMREKYNATFFMNYLPPTGIDGVNPKEGSKNVMDRYLEAADADQTHRPKMNLTIEFTDAGGRRWVRQTDGTLTPHVVPGDKASGVLLPA